MKILIKDEKAFRATVATDDKVWQAVKAQLEKTVDPRDPAEGHRIASVDGIVVHHGIPDSRA